MVTLSVKVDDEMANRLDALAKAMSGRAAGAQVTRSNAMRVALEHGVDALEVEFGMKRKKR